MLEALGRFQHGGDIYRHRGIVDFSANLNPLGIPERVKRALTERVDEFAVYPDPACGELRAAIAQMEGVSFDSVVCTAGATDLMHRVCLALRPRTALVTAPCFSGYEQALEQVGAHVVRHRLREEDGFHLTASIVDAVEALALPGELQDGSNLMFLCTPNNPTGITIARDLLIDILEAACALRVVVVLDECFLDFTEEESAVGLCCRFSNLIVMKAFTKTYAMAGLRLGYGICCDEALMERLVVHGQPWAVSTPAQIAGVAALADPSWHERTRTYVKGQRQILLEGLRSCGMQVVSGEANYLLFRAFPGLYELMMERGFMIRRCANYVGLDDSWYRIAVRTAEENEAFLSALRGVCAWPQNR